MIDKRRWNQGLATKAGRELIEHARARRGLRRRVGLVMPGNEASAAVAHLAALASDTQRADAQALVALLSRLGGEPAAMRGPSIVGFGRYRDRYDGGREGDAPLAGFAARAKEPVLYLAQDFPGREAALARLVRHRAGVGCVCVKRLADVDAAVLEGLVVASLAWTRSRHPV
jgi:hypothetical protein